MYALHTHHFILFYFILFIPLFLYLFIYYYYCNDLQLQTHFGVHLKPKNAHLMAANCPITVKRSLKK